MKIIYISIFILFSSSALADSDYIMSCKSKLSNMNVVHINYILNIKEGLVEILHREKTEKGVLGTNEHFYTLYFTFNNKLPNEIVRKIIVNRITGQLTQTETSKSSYPNTIAEIVTGTCKVKKYERKL